MNAENLKRIERYKQFIHNQPTIELEQMITYAEDSITFMLEQIEYYKARKEAAQTEINNRPQRNA